MPKNSVDSTMKAHLAQGVTTLAACWHIVRTDGAQFGFTTFDVDIVVEGITYLSTAGFSQTAIQSGSTGQIDNLNVMGFFSDSPGGVTERDVKNRMFDYARVYLFFINWKSPGFTPIRMRTGWLGETVVSPNGTFSAELRGLTQALVQELGNFYSPLCRADLGDSKCKVPIKPQYWQAGQLVPAGFYVRPTNPTDEGLMQAIFKAKNQGTTGPGEPPWAITVGANVEDFQVVWECVPAYRQIGIVLGVLDRHSFHSNPLSYPAGASYGATASIMTTNSVSIRTLVEISDGINTCTVEFFTDTKKEQAIGRIADVLIHSNLALAGLAWIGPNDRPIGLTITIGTGLRGSVTKSGDILGGIIIENFGDPYLDAGSLEWMTGNNTGVSMELKTYDPASNTVSMYLGMMMPIAINDKFWYHPGCDKRRDTCLKKFNNILNMRAETDIPGIDRMLSYPDA